MNWTRLALNIPTIINVAVTAVEHINGANGPRQAPDLGAIRARVIAMVGREAQR